MIEISNVGFNGIVPFIHLILALIIVVLLFEVFWRTANELRKSYMLMLSALFIYVIGVVLSLLGNLQIISLKFAKFTFLFDIMFLILLGSSVIVTLKLINKVNSRFKKIYSKKRIKKNKEVKRENDNVSDM